MKFILLHEGKNDEGIRAFFTDVWELYVKVRADSLMARTHTHGRDIHEDYDRRC
jgi:hypothetical protein